MTDQTEALREALYKAVDMALNFSPEPASRKAYLEGAIGRVWKDAATPPAEDHALHFDPDCEECVYLARPTVIRLAADPDPTGQGLWGKP